MKERYRERRAYALVETLAQDVRYALRTLRKSPGFAATSVAVLALAIGANTTMFRVLNAVLLRPLPYPSPEQLAMLWSEDPGQNLREGRTAYRSIEEWRRQSKSFADMAVFDPVRVTLTTAVEAEQVSVARISPNFFPLLGIHPLLGRNFSDEEAEQGQRLALISHRFWQARFGGSPDAIGATIELDGLPSRIIGILPADFQFAMLSEDIWEPYSMFPDWETRRGVRGADTWFVLGRLRPNVTLEQAQAEMSAIARRLGEQLPAPEPSRGISVVPLSRQLTGPRSRLALWMLTGARLLPGSLPPHRDPGRTGAGDHPGAKGLEALCPGRRKRCLGRSRHAPDPPRPRDHGVRVGNHSAGWRRPADPKPVVGGERRSGIQA